MDCTSKQSDPAWVGRIASAAIRSAQPSSGTAEGARRWIVAYSGGVDSTVLLHVLREALGGTGGSIVAVHVHHGLHASADDWAAHCRRVCDALDIPLTVMRVAVARDGGEGVEAAARRARYAAFETVASDAGDRLVTGHHRDDQAETFLLRALRASGTDGLGAMREWRRFGTGWLWRPLLDVPRAELLSYAQRKGLDWIEDPSNLDTDLDRNFLRNRVLPLLRERWPRADAAFARSAALHAETADLLDAEDAVSLADASTVDPNVLSVDCLLHMTPARQARVLRRWIATLGLPALPGRGLTRILTDLLHADPDSEATFAWAHARVVRWRDVLHADWQPRPWTAPWMLPWDGRAVLQLPGNGGRLMLCAHAITPFLGFDRQLIVRPRAGGERIVLPGRIHSHSLKHVLQSLGVPPWERARMPLLSDDEGNVHAAGDLAFSAQFDAWLLKQTAHLQWIPADMAARVFTRQGRPCNPPAF